MAHFLVIPFLKVCYDTLFILQFLTTYLERPLAERYVSQLNLSKFPPIYVKRSFCFSWSLQALVQDLLWEHSWIFHSYSLDKQGNFNHNKTLILKTRCQWSWVWCKVTSVYLLLILIGVFFRCHCSLSRNILNESCHMISRHTTVYNCTFM